MIQGINAALSGLRAYINQTNVTADNLANINTPGFKSSTAVQQAMPSNLGVMTTAMQTTQGQGALMETMNSLNMGISGAGFFKVKGPNGEAGYTRSGDFRIDSKGRLTDQNGNAVQGYSLKTGTGGSVVKSGTAGDIYLTGGQGSPGQTSNFTLGMNLDASAPTGSKFSSTFNITNSLGETVPLTMNFTKAGAGAWDYTTTGPAGLTISGPGAAGTLNFDSSGALIPPATNPDMTVSGFSSGAAPVTMTWNLADPATGTSLGNVTSYASQSTMTSFSSNGYGTGPVGGISVGQDGVISAMMNGKSIPVGQVELYNFNNQNGLERGGNNIYYETAASGQPIQGSAGAGGFGQIAPSSLEMSNVDLGEQMVGLIQSKYGFSAQTKMIRAADDMLGSLLNIKT